jgi:DMSO/TMAO reductase YedYZ molybdopterin-dependent catalytic subunit
MEMPIIHPVGQAGAPAAPARPVPRWRGAVAGLIAAGVALGVAELVAGLVRGTTSPVISVGELVIEHTPSWMKDFAIERFGTNDKPALIAGTLVLLAVFAVVIGALATRRLWIGLVGIGAFGVVGIAAALTRPNAEAVAVVPTVVGTLAALVALAYLVRGRLRPGDVVAVRPPNEFDRRRFLLSAAVISGAVVAAGGVGRLLQQRFDVGAARSDLSLPPPASPAAAVPAGAELGVPGISSFTTPNDVFYRIDTALVAPQVQPDGWRLRIHGMVDRELTFSYQDLVERELVERDITLVCVSNEVGGPYVGNARWLGVPLADLLREAGVQDGADQLVSRSVDGWTAGTPTSVVMDGRDALVAIGMNGEPLPIVNGFPARMVVPGLYGFTSATKWLTDLELTTFDAYDAYWVQRGWAREAPIKTLTRIDTPQGLAKLAAGTVPVAGMAWAPHTGIEAVEVRIDQGPWQPARLGEVPSSDTWRQWVYEWDATPGSHTIEARATNADGEVQTEDRAEPIPDGASGWHSVVVRVS